MTGPLGTLILLPGVPHEMQALLREQVVSRITALTGPGGAVLAHRTLRTAGISESALADLLGPIEPELSPLELAYLPGLGGVDLRLLIGSEATAHATAALDAAANRLLGLLGDHCYGIDEADLAGVVVEQLRARRGRVAVAESCTGGLIGARITAIPGASDVFAGGIISYEDASKVRELGVEAELIARFGAVSEEVVTAMARGVRRRFQTDTAIAVTGIAGPSGGRPDKPVGTVWTAVAVGEEVTSQGRRFPGGREEVRARAAARALDLLRRRLSRSRA
jgi:nicotinamide-nucleotide amidase